MVSPKSPDNPTISSVGSQEQLLPSTPQKLACSWIFTAKANTGFVPGWEPRSSPLLGKAKGQALCWHSAQSVPGLLGVICPRESCPKAANRSPASTPLPRNAHQPVGQELLLPQQPVPHPMSHVPRPMSHFGWPQRPRFLRSCGVAADSKARRQIYSRSAHRALPQLFSPLYMPK